MNEFECGIWGYLEKMDKLYGYNAFLSRLFLREYRAYPGSPPGLLMSYHLSASTPRSTMLVQYIVFTHSPKKWNRMNLKVLSDCAKIGPKFYFLNFPACF